MFKKLLTLPLAVIFSATPVLAAQIPVAFKLDERIKRYTYEENNVYALSLRLRSVTAIQFSPSETVETIIIGDSTSWDVIKLKSGNVISVKPVLDGVLTNMTIYTDQRVYSFELSADGNIQPGSAGDQSQTYRIVFTYPEEEARAKQAAKQEPELQGPLNYNYKLSGQSSFRPVEVRDDTYRTYFVLPPNSPRPAIYKVGADNREKLVNTRSRGNLVVVDGTSDFWVMRLGDQYICVGRSSAVVAQNIPQR